MLFVTQYHVMWNFLSLLKVYKMLDLSFVLRIDLILLTGIFSGRYSEDSFGPLQVLKGNWSFPFKALSCLALQIILSNVLPSTSRPRHGPSLLFSNKLHIRREP